jgi:hypothetical protein
VVVGGTVVTGTVVVVTGTVVVVTGTVVVAGGGEPLASVLVPPELPPASPPFESPFDPSPWSPPCVVVGETATGVVVGASPPPSACDPPWSPEP